MEPAGIDILRKAVNLFNNCNETFNQQFTENELLKLYRMFSICGWDIPPDRWTVDQIDGALILGKVPAWDDDEKPARSEAPPICQNCCKDPCAGYDNCP